MDQRNPFYLGSVSSLSRSVTAATFLFSASQQQDYRYHLRHIFIVLPPSNTSKNKQIKLISSSKTTATTVLLSHQHHILLHRYFLGANRRAPSWTDICVP